MKRLVVVHTMGTENCREWKKYDKFLFRNYLATSSIKYIFILIFCIFILLSLVHKGILSEEKEIEQLTKGQTQPQTLEDRRSGRLIGVVHTTEEKDDETKYKGENEGLQKTDNLEEKYKNADEHQSCKPETNESEEIIKERTDDYGKFPCICRCVVVCVYIKTLSLQNVKC